MAETDYIGLYLPSRTDQGIPIDESLATNFRKIDESVKSTDTRIDGLDTKYNNIGSKINGIDSRFNFVNIKEFGAKGDGKTDDTQAFINAFNTAKTNGSLDLYVPDGDYIMDGYAELWSNSHIRLSKGARIIKGPTSTTQYCFLMGRTTTSKGYGSGPKNITIEGGRFEGYEGSGVSFTSHHVSGLHVRNCVFYLAIRTGHVFDLAGCENVLIEDCEFHGMNVQSGREYAEAIQIDCSTSEGLSGNYSNYDGLPTRNVTVQRCKFLPIYENGKIKYPAPNAMGAHNFVEGMYYTNLRFIDNIVQDAPARVSGNTGCWVRFYAGDGIIISGNRFINTTSTHCVCVGFHSKANATLFKDVALADAPSSSVTPIPCKNIIVENNIFIGFDSVKTGLYVVEVDGHKSKGEYVKNAKILNNTFLEGMASSAAKGTDVGSDVIYGNMVDGLYIEGNVINTARRMCYVGDSKNILIRGNEAINCYFLAISTSNNVGLIIDKNLIRDCAGAIYTAATIDLIISDNEIYNISDSAKAKYNNVIAMKECTNGLCTRNILRDTLNTTFTRAIHCYTSGSYVAILDNIVKGFDKPIEVTTTEPYTIRNLFEVVV